MEPASGKPRPTRVQCVDWRIDVEGTELRFTPSGRTIARQLWATLLAAILIGAIIVSFGMPPGTRRHNADVRRVEQLSRQLDQARQQRDRVATSTTGRDSPVFQGMQQTVERIEQQLATQQQRLAGATPTLGPTGDRVYWTAIGVLIAAGLFFPVVALFTRVHLRYDGPPGRGTLTLVERDLWPRRKDFAAQGFTAMAIHIQRIVTHSRRYHTTTDHGWMWTIILLADRNDSRARDLHLSVEIEPTLPADPAKLTARVRDVVRYLEAVTTLTHHPPVQTDVADIIPTAFSSKRILRTRHHGHADS